MAVKLDFASGNESLYGLVARSDKFVVRNDEPTYTVQSDLEDADINNIVRRFGLTGTMPQGLRVPEYGDFDMIDDYHGALIAIQNADKEFMSMPADVRAKFNNDAGQFFDFAVDPANIDALRDLGLAVPKPVEIIITPPVDPVNSSVGTNGNNP